MILANEGDLKKSANKCTACSETGRRKYLKRRKRFKYIDILKIKDKLNYS
jgi:hypothetical protein